MKNKMQAETCKNLAQDYFLLCREQEIHPSLPGLALALGLSSRQELSSLAAGTGRRAEILRGAITQVEEANIQSLYQKDQFNSAKFVLQSAFGYGERAGAEALSGSTEEKEIHVSISSGEAP